MKRTVRWFTLLSFAAVIVVGVRQSSVAAQGIPTVAQADGAESTGIPLELVDLSGLTAADTALLIDQLILTTAQVERGVSSTTLSDAVPPRHLHPVTSQPFTTVLTGAAVAHAEAHFDSITGSHRVDVELSDAGGEVLATFTESRIGEAMGIVVDGRVVSAPIVRTRLGKRFVVEGSFSAEEARELAARLMNASPLPRDAFPDISDLQLLPVDFSLIVDSIGAILLLVVILRL
ncbi:MAG: hypothetical protein IPM16_05145 [Chloroflexi bacterium]|nr:hypothetical protein [Chloroflexota bacterium]